MTARGTGSSVRHGLGIPMGNPWEVEWATHGYQFLENERVLGGPGYWVACLTCKIVLNYIKLAIFLLSVPFLEYLCDIFLNITTVAKLKNTF